jgi:hypothetical protein
MRRKRLHQEIEKDTLIEGSANDEKQQDRYLIFGIQIEKDGETVSIAVSGSLRKKGSGECVALTDEAVVELDLATYQKLCRHSIQNSDKLIKRRILDISTGSRKPVTTSKEEFMQA